MVRILGLQRTHQQLKLRQSMQVLETVVFQEEGPTGKTGADASLQPLKSRLALSRKRKNAGDLVVSVVGVTK